MASDKVDRRLRNTAGGTAGFSGIIYGISVLLDQGSKQLRGIRTFKDPKDLREFLRGSDPNARVAVTGKTWTDDPLPNVINGQKAVASKVIHAEMISTRTDAGIRPGERLLSCSRKAAPMFIEWGNSKLHLLPKDLKDLDPVLEHAGTLCRDPKFHPLRSIIEGYANNSFVVRQEEREYILPLGAEITAIGQVQERGKDYAVGPYQGHMSFSTLTLEQQMQKLDRWSSRFRVAGLCCIVLSTACAGALLGYRILKAWRRRKDRQKELQYLKAAEASRQARRQAAERNTANGVDAAGNQQWHCLVCWNEGSGVKQAVFPACGHVAVCEECSRHLSQCPLCRTKSTPRRLYYS